MEYSKEWLSEDSVVINNLKISDLNLSWWISSSSSGKS